MLSLRLLGSPLFLVNGVSLTGLRYPQGRKLLAYLALQEGRPVERTYLAGLFWPETDEARALFYLRRVLSDLRKALGEDAACLVCPTPRTLALKGIECALTSEDTGELLQGWTEDWVLAARQRTQPSLSPSAPLLLGREELLNSVLALLPNTPLITLTGPGGVGKTRLARAVAEATQARVAKGTRVGFVSLASLPPESTQEELLHTLATALELPVSGLAPQLKAHYTLIVLDNCEQVCLQCSVLVKELLRELAGVRFLATSRIPLQSEGEGEVLISVPPLALEIATTLFLEHAKTVGSPCRRDETVAAICQSVDCLPLALELAASRLSLMTPIQLRERLSAPLRVLRRSHPGGQQQSAQVSRRQATLEATIQWSYSLLPEPERLAFIGLGVFQNDWSLEDAEAILETPDASTLLESLVRQSLLVARRTETQIRFSFLETIREFARAQCHEPAVHAAAAAHARYFYTLAQSVRPGQRLGIRQLEAARREFATALSWFQAHDPTSGIELMLALETFWVRLSSGFPSRECLAGLLLAAGDALSLTHKIQATRLLAALTPDYSIAHALLTKAQTLATASSLERPCADCLLSLCLLEKQRDADAVGRYARQARECFQNLGDIEGEAYALEYEAVAALCQGKLAQAEHGYTQFLVLARQLESHISTGDALYGLAQALILQERYREAEQAAQEAAQQMPDAMGQANVSYLLGELARHTGSLEKALPHYTEALRLCHDNTIQVLPAFIERSRAIVLTKQRDFSAAWASIQRALVEFRRYNIGAQLGSTLAEMAWIALQEGKPREARVFLEQAAQAPKRDIRHPRDIARLHAL